MRTLTITLHDTDNCGSSLQAYALQHFLLKNGIDNQLVDYLPTYTQNNGKGLRTLLRKLVFYRDSVSRAKKFRQFKADFLHVTEKSYHTSEELKADPPVADIYITGSDQLWNDAYRCGRDSAYYLDFVRQGKKLAYAVSLGRANIPEENKKRIARYASDFQGITVREKSSVSQLEHLLGQPVTHVCDPVLLNCIREYDKIKGPRLIQEPYILLYLAQSTQMDKIEEMAQTLKREKRAKVVLIGSYRNRCINDIHLRDVAPADFLSLIANAEYVISNSFHATMFSLMYQKQFMTVLPPENGARIQEILNLAGLEDHAIQKSTQPLWIDPQEYEQAAEKLEVFRDESARHLLHLLKVEHD